MKLKKILKEVQENNKRKEKMDFLMKQWKERLEEIKGKMRKRGYEI